MTNFMMKKKGGSMRIRRLVNPNIPINRSPKRKTGVKARVIWRMKNMKLMTWMISSSRTSFKIKNRLSPLNLERAGQMESVINLKEGSRGWIPLNKKSLIENQSRIMKIMMMNKNIPVEKKNKASHLCKS